MTDDKSIVTKEYLENHTSNKSNPHSVTKSQIGLGNVGNFKAVSTVANQGLTESEKANARENMGVKEFSISVQGSKLVISK